jgi:hypothetical protein
MQIPQEVVIRFYSQATAAMEAHPLDVCWPNGPKTKSSCANSSPANVTWGSRSTRAANAALPNTPLNDLTHAGGWNGPAMPMSYIDRSRIANQGVHLGDESMGRSAPVHRKV